MTGSSVALVVDMPALVAGSMKNLMWTRETSPYMPGGYTPTVYFRVCA